MLVHLALRSGPNKAGLLPLRLFRSKANRKFSVGIEIRNSGYAIGVCSGANFDEDTAARFHLNHLKVLDKDASQGDLAEALENWVEDAGVKGCDCHITMSGGAYQLLLTDAPDVPDTELRSALRWKINDLTTTPIEKAAVEAFLLPDDATRSDKKMAYVVVTELEKIQNIIEIIKEVGLNLSSIDIAELSIRNLSLLTPEGQPEARGVAIVRLVSGSATVYLFREGNLYLSRHFNMNYGGGLLDDIPEDGFLLEVQRSLDYYERQMGQVPPASLYVCGENISADKVTQSISRGLSVPVKFLDLETLFSFDESLELDLMQECSGALGAVLRPYLT